jgi:2-keto-4-pentenoate hydratase/ketosteroid isomerase-like protein
VRRPAYYGNPAGVTEDVAVVRAIFDAFARRDVEALLGHLAPDCEIYLEGTAVHAGRALPYRGHDGMREYLGDVAKVWDELVLHPEDFRVVPGSVVVMGHVSGTRDGRRTRRAAVWVWRVRDGRATSIRVADMGELSGVHPRVAAATRAQLTAWRAALAAGAERVGWKLGLDIPEIGEPTVGHLTTATLLEPGAAFRADGAAKLRAETELAIAVLRDVEDGADARAAIGGYGVALELVDVERPAGGGLEAIVEANVFHRAVVLGPRTERVPAGEARLLVDGTVRETAPMAREPAAAVRAVAEVLGAAGERLRAGDVIIAGSLTHVPVGPGQAVAAEIDGLGRVDLAIT